MSKTQNEDDRINELSWLRNYLYLSQKIAEEDDPERRQELATAVRNGSVVSWQHINLHGEYDFSDEKLQDSVGLRLPKIMALELA